MFRKKIIEAGVFTLVTFLSSFQIGSELSGTHLPMVFFSAAQAASEAAQTTLPVSKAISKAYLSKLDQISVTVEEAGKEIKYTGVSLRSLFIDMLPEYKLTSMPEWKALNRRALVMEVKGEDGYPGLIPAIDIAMNKSGDRFILAIQRDGKDLDGGIQLICKTDEAHTRWVHQVVSARVVALPQ